MKALIGRTFVDGPFLYDQSKQINHFHISPRKGKTQCRTSTRQLVSSISNNGDRRELTTTSACSVRLKLRLSLAILVGQLSQTPSVEWRSEHADQAPVQSKESTLTQPKQSTWARRQSKNQAKLIRRRLGQSPSSAGNTKERTEQKQSSRSCKKGTIINQSPAKYRYAQGLDVLEQSSPCRQLRETSTKSCSY